MVRLVLANSLIAMVFLASCREATFRGGSARVNTCQENEKAVGINVVAIIDNSNSHSYTDCVDPQNVGVFPGTRTVQYECQAATNRETAVASAFDILGQNVIANDERSRSRFAITSFPTEADISNGHEVHANGWLDVDPNAKSTVTEAMAFSRRPAGKTPYAAGLTGASSLFGQVSDDDRPKVAILITDGEPTDSNAANAKQKAATLKQSGVKVITIFVTGDQTRSERLQRHVNYLANVEGQSQQNINELLGQNGSVSLVDSISDEKIEVTNASEIQRVLEDVIVKSVGCE